MSEQMIISIGREFGSGGHEIAQRLANIYRLPLYDHNLLNEISSISNLDSAELVKLDEMKRNKLLSRTVRGMNNSPAHNVAYIQFDYLKKKSEAGESFVVVGRCSETILKDNKNMISIFILGDMEKKVERISRMYQISAKEAENLIREKEKKRKQYHNSYCQFKWGDSRNYDLSVNSSKLGIDETIHMLTAYIDARVKKT